jgi:hypothetical protein
MNVRDIVEQYCKVVSSTPGYLCEWNTEDLDVIGMDYKPGDIAICWNWESEHIDGTRFTNDEFDIHEKREQEGFDRIFRVMDTLGYNYVDVNDGSGGGLHYGAYLFRKGYIAPTSPTKD